MGGPIHVGVDSLGRRRAKKGGDLPPPPAGLDLPPPPPPSALGLPPPPSPEDLDLGLPKIARRTGSKRKNREEEAEVEVEVISSGDSKPRDTRYASLWERTGSKPLKQMYGQIDRLGSGEVGSLLDRYSSRFGRELDRELIVLRGREIKATRATSGTPEVIEEVETVLGGEDDAEDLGPEETDMQDSSDEDGVGAAESKTIPQELGESPTGGDSTDEAPSSHLDPVVEEELRGEIETLERKIRPLHDRYRLAKQRGQTAKIEKAGNQLKPLVARRRAVLEVLSGEKPMEDLVKSTQRPKPKAARKDMPPADHFAHFVSIVDDLLTKLPDERIEEFISSDDFLLYSEVGGSPEGASNDVRRDFFALVDGLLSELPEDTITQFSQSADFSTYIEVGQQFRKEG